MSRLELAERIIELREHAGLTQGEAAKRARVGVTTWSNIETGTITRPHARTVIKMARTLGVEPEELLEVPEAPKAAAPPSPDPPKEAAEEGRRIPTAAEMNKATATLERLIARRREAIERWHAAGVDALEEAACGWFDMDRANDQIYRDLRHLGADEVITNQRTASEEDLEAAFRQTNAFGRLLGIAAEAHNVAAELSREAGEASEAAARTFAELESLWTAAQGERELRWQA